MDPRMAMQGGMGGMMQGGGGGMGMNPMMQMNPSMMGQGMHGQMGEAQAMPVSFISYFSSSRL